MVKASKPKAKSNDAAATFRMDADLIRKLKYVALMDNTTQTEIIEGLLTEHIEKWEKKHGPIPKK